MDLITYEKIWNASVKPKIDRMLSSDDDIFFIGEQVKYKIWQTYEDYKNKVHSYMRNPDGRIDRHKIASVMLYSVIVNKPFDLRVLSSNQQIRGSSFLANEILGFNTAMAIVLSFLLEEANKKSDKIKIEIFKKGFIFPECQYDDYPTHVWKMLYYAKYNNHYDIFAFSHVLFLIEAYTELKRRRELAEKVL
ncbi:MAG: hypothetical protein FWH53_08005 [Leptospirales bacterium]|nr:hypothetical protein [Leptospirales bacterium]